MSLIAFLHDHRWWVLAICLPLIVIYGRVLFLAAFGAGAPATKPMTAPLRRLPPKPGSLVKPAATPPPEGRQEVLPSSLDAGASGHQKAGAAKTVKLPVSPSKPTDSSPITGRQPTTDLPRGKDAAADSEADALDGLFGKRDEPAVPSETPSVALRRKATRMEELGFHHGIANMPIEGKPGAPPAATPAPAAPPASPAILPDGTPRSSTAELTSILERIDKFLAEDTPAKPAPTVPPNVATTAVVRTVSDPEALAAAQKAVTEAMPPVAPASTASDDAAKAAKGTEAMIRTEPTPAKADPNKKTQPMWARPDALDEDVEDKAKDEKKPDGGDQQRLF